MGRVRVTNLIELLGYGTILITYILREADTKSEIKFWLPAWGSSSAILLGKDPSKQQNLLIAADPDRRPLTGAHEWARCSAELREAQVPHSPQIRLKSWIRVCLVPCAPQLCPRGLCCNVKCCSQLTTARQTIYFYNLNVYS